MPTPNASGAGFEEPQELALPHRIEEQHRPVVDPMTEESGKSGVRRVQDQWTDDNSKDAAPDMGTQGMGNPVLQDLAGTFGSSGQEGGTIQSGEAQRSEHAPLGPVPSQLHDLNTPPTEDAAASYQDHTCSPPWEGTCGLTSSEGAVENLPQVHTSSGSLLVEEAAVDPLATPAGPLALAMPAQATPAGSPAQATLAELSAQSLPVTEIATGLPAPTAGQVLVYSRRGRDRPGKVSAQHAAEANQGEWTGTPAQDEPVLVTAAPPDESGVAALDEQATVFLDDITTGVEDMQHVPPPQQARRRRPHTTTTTPLRRSRRIAASGSAASSIQRAQIVLMKRLGIPVEQSMTQQNAEEYARLFDHPLSSSHVAALAALFGWTAPDNSEVHPTILL